MEASFKNRNISDRTAAMLLSLPTLFTKLDSVLLLEIQGHLHIAVFYLKATKLMK